MKSVRLYAQSDLRIGQENPPVPGAGERLIRVRAVGICGSDLHWYNQAAIGDAQLARPLILGHEIAGVTESGQLVAVDPAIPCKRCEFCLQGNPNLCPQVIFAGHGEHDGGLRECLTWPEQNLFPLPEPFSAEDGAMLEPLGVALHAVDLGKLKPGMVVGVYGCGSIGLLIIQLARLANPRKIIATDVLPHRVEAAKAFGAQEAFQARGQATGELLISAGERRGVDVAFDVSGEQGAVDAAMEAVIPGGKVILVGIPDHDQTIFQASTARRKGLTIKLVRRMKNTYPRAINLVAQGQIDVRSLVTHRFPLEQASEAFEVAARRDGLKVMINL